MGEVQSPGQELQLVMPEWQPRAAGHWAPGMSTSLGPPFTLHYNDKNISHLYVELITRTPHPNSKGKAMGDYHKSRASQRWWNANNLKSPFVQAMAWGRRQQAIAWVTVDEYDYDYN